ncbi:MAG: hypothetical protein K8R23_01615 [Chthoniobacter sp.]|nr:hypothetical protein [Chthoniobacter sp.]
MLAILLLPALASTAWLPPREQIYSSVPWMRGPYPYLHQQIFEEKADIDIAFAGSSFIWFGIDTPYVQQELSVKLGRQAVVRSINWPFPGFDALYFIAQDLLQNRKVRMLVIYDDYLGRDTPEYREQDAPHSMSPRLFRFADNSEVLAGMPIQSKAAYYFGAVLGMPRNLLSLCRTNLEADLSSANRAYWENTYNASDPAKRLGSMYARLGFDADRYNPKFTEYTPHAAAQSSDACVFSPATKALFRFQGHPTPVSQLQFARKITKLAKKHGTKVVWLHLPVIGEMGSSVIEEREFWPDALHADLMMAGIPPARFFQGMTAEDARKLFFISNHLNQNGQKYFTPLITPTLLELYDAPFKP